VPAPAAPLPKAPFASRVGGAGILEASNGNIAVGTGVSGIVSATLVKWGDHVGAGDALFKIDDRDVQSQLLSARAGIKEAQAKLRQAREQLRLVESVPDRRAISTAERDGHRFAVEIAQAGLEAAQARRDQLTLEIGRRTVRALAPGKILQINIRPGEFAQSGVLARPLMLLGNDSRLYVRVDIDEFDAARITPGAAAVAFVRADAQRQVRLTFERIEPYVAPKTSLTGGATERVDTRVLQVIYSFEHAALPVYIGQQMDVYIEAPPARTAP
jgi:RND family efflux transporter MFP subunit